jgi:hypothetical protein
MDGSTNLQVGCPINHHAFGIAPMGLGTILMDPSDIKTLRVKYLVMVIQGVIKGDKRHHR